MNKAKKVICEKVAAEEGSADIMVYILPNTGFTHYVGDVKRYRVAEGVLGEKDALKPMLLEKEWLKLAKHCFVAFPAYHMQALYHPPSVMEIDEAHPFVWVKEGEEDFIYVDTEGLMSSQ